MLELYNSLLTLARAATSLSFMRFSIQHRPPAARPALMVGARRECCDITDQNADITQ